MTVFTHLLFTQHVFAPLWHHWLHSFGFAKLVTTQCKVDNAQYSATGTRTRVARVRAEYPNQLDYSGHVDLFFATLLCMFVAMFLPAGLWRSGFYRRHSYKHLPLQFAAGRPDWGSTKKLFTLLDLCVSSLRRGHANLLCIVPILTDDPRRESERCASRLGHTLLKASQLPALPVGRGGAQRSRGTSSCSKAPKGIHKGSLALSHEHVQ